MNKYFSFLNRIKKIFKSKTLKMIIVSFLTVVITIFIAFIILWLHRDKIIKFISSHYIPSQIQYITKEEPLPAEKTEDKQNKALVPEIKKEEATIVNAVKKVRPAVVSIVVSQEVPKYDVTYDKQEAKDSSGKTLPGVYVETPVYKENGTQYKQTGSGSGFLISSDGMIVTNKHVIEKEGLKYTVMLNNEKEYVATVLARDPVLDFALLKIEAKNLPYLKLGDSSKLEIGESVVAIGNALGEFKNTVSAGVVSGLSRNIMASVGNGVKEYLYDVIQTDAAINPGNSGGPLVNISGEVVGINVAAAEDSSNIGFSLPINSIKDIITQVKKTGKISRPYAGIRYINITPEIKKEFNLSVDLGILVYKGSGEKEPAVLPGSPADKAGILEGDVIVSINGEPIGTTNDFMTIVRTKKIGEKITLKIISKGVEKDVVVKLEEIPENI